MAEALSFNMFISPCMLQAQACVRAGTCLGDSLWQPRSSEVHVAPRALVQHHEVSCRDVVADENMPLRWNEGIIVPPHIDAQQEQQDCAN